VKRGELVTVAAKGHYSSKPRPAVVIQSDLFADLDSVTLCLLSSEHVQSPLIRLAIDPTPENGLDTACAVMIDKVVTVPRAATGPRIGSLDRETLVRVDRSLALFLGIA
jgi:mRNA interferase MazF